MSSEQAREERAYATGIQAARWGLPLIFCLKTPYAGAKAAAVGVNYYRKFSELKTKDKFVNTPNNVSIDGYCAAELRVEPLVVKVSPIKEDRGSTLLLTILTVFMVAAPAFTQDRHRSCRPKKTLQRTTRLFIELATRALHWDEPGGPHPHCRAPLLHRHERPEFVALCYV